MDKGTITALKLAGYKVVRSNSMNMYEWLLNDSDNGYEEESDSFFSHTDDAWKSALRHLQTGENDL